MASKSVALQRDLFDYGTLPQSAIKQCESSVDRITKLQRRMAGDIIAVGKELLAVKAKLEHGQFGEWIRYYFGWSHRTCDNMIAAAEVFGEIANFANLTIDTSALYLLASDKCPDETREEFIERAEAGEHITHAAVKQQLDGDKYELSYDDRIDKLMSRIRAMANHEQRAILIASLKVICQELENDE